MTVVLSYNTDHVLKMCFQAYDVPPAAVGRLDVHGPECIGIVFTRRVYINYTHAR